jgi:hypothetical protein
MAILTFSNPGIQAAQDHGLRKLPQRGFPDTGRSISDRQSVVHVLFVPLLTTSEGWLHDTITMAVNETKKMQAGFFIQEGFVCGNDDPFAKRKVRTFLLNAFRSSP